MKNRKIVPMLVVLAMLATVLYSKSAPAMAAPAMAAPVVSATETCDCNAFACLAAVGLFATAIGGAAYTAPAVATFTTITTVGGPVSGAVGKALLSYGLKGIALKFGFAQTATATISTGSAIVPSWLGGMGTVASSYGLSKCCTC